MLETQTVQRSRSTTPTNEGRTTVPRAATQLLNSACCSGERGFHCKNLFLENTNVMPYRPKRHQKSPPSPLKSKTNTVNNTPPISASSSRPASKSSLRATSPPPLPSLTTPPPLPALTTSPKRSSLKKVTSSPAKAAFPSMTMNNKQVHFASTATEHLYLQKSLTRQQRKTLWYTSKEIRAIRRQMCALNLTATCPTKGPMLRQAFETIDNTWRGLEHIRDGKMTQKLEHRKLFVRNFLYFCRDLGVVDVHALAVFSVSNSRPDRHHAVTKATQDALEACQIYHDFLTLESHTPQARAAQYDCDLRLQQQEQFELLQRTDCSELTDKDTSFCSRNAATDAPSVSSLSHSSETAGSTESESSSKKRWFRRERGRGFFRRTSSAPNKPKKESSKGPLRMLRFRSLSPSR